MRRITYIYTMLRVLLLLLLKIFKRWHINSSVCGGHIVKWNFSSTQGVNSLECSTIQPDVLVSIETTYIWHLSFHLATVITNSVITWVFIMCANVITTQQPDGNRPFAIKYHICGIFTSIFIIP
jgi:hypothetical protein